MNTNLNEILEKSNSMSDIARAIFGKENYTNREKCKKILSENGVDWQEWSKKKKEKPKKYCLYCGKEIVGKCRSNKKFCNSSCAASYNNNGVTRNYKGGPHKSKCCLNCGKNLNKTQTYYCSRECQTEYEYKKYIERWKNGEENGQSGVGGISDRIKRYLFGKYNNSCQCCGWSEKNKYTNNVPLQIHHIDGDCTNNKEENLQLLCPNCHSLTETFGSIGKYVSKRVDRRKKYFRQEVESDLKKNIEDVSRCIVCGRKLEAGQTTYCSNACKNRERIKNITKEDILNAFKNTENTSYGKVAKALNISQTGLTKKCEKFGIKNEIQKIRFGI